MDDILKEIEEENIDQDTNKKVDDIVRENPALIDKYPILEIEYNLDGTKKDIYSLASERDIKKMQIQSDKNELDYNLSQNKISQTEYKDKIEDINKKINDIDLIYDDLIFEIIDTMDMNEIEKSISSYNLNNIDLDRLARAISSVSENKIDEFRENNKTFMMDKLSYWNYKYNKISKAISKAREVESFIISLIEN